MTRTRLLLLAVSLAVSLGACVTPQPVGPILKSDYPPPEASPETVFAFFKRAAANDDPEAAYYCLGRPITDQVGIGTFYEGWTLVGRYIRLFGDARVTDSRDVREGRVLTVELCGLSEPFLWVKEDAGWRLYLPTRHSKRKDLQELFEAVKVACANKLEPRVRPARRGG